MKKIIFLTSITILLAGCSFNIQTKQPEIPVLESPTTSTTSDENNKTIEKENDRSDSEKPPKNNVAIESDNAEKETDAEVNQNSQSQSQPDSESKPIDTTVGSQDSLIIEDTANVENTENIVTLLAQGKKYIIPFQENTSVYESMQKLSARSADHFYFVAREYPGMGFFVEEINGLKNDNRAGIYWIYYINGQSAKIGISNYIIKSGDIIEWKYEKSTF